VKISHLNLLNFLESMRDVPGMKPGEKMLGMTSISFDISAFELILPLVAGGTIVLASRDDARDGKEIARLVEHWGIDFIQGTPSTYRMLISTGWKPSKNTRLMIGGEPVSSEIAQFLLQYAGELWNGYGPTETTIISTCKRIEDPYNITVGKPIANTEIIILSQKKSLVPFGSYGEICIGGFGVGLGYLNSPDLNSNRFISNSS
jgi:non-ribosomal peptide synthetase component F